MNDGVGPGRPCPHSAAGHAVVSTARLAPSRIPTVAQESGPSSGARPSRGADRDAGRGGAGRRAPGCSSNSPHSLGSWMVSHRLSPKNTWAGPVRTPVDSSRPGSASAAASAAGSTSRRSGSRRTRPGWITTVCSGPASAPRILMNPHGASDRLAQCPPERPNATDSCVPPTSSGTTIRAPGVTCSSHAEARSLTPTVAISRSYGACAAQPSAPSAQTVITSGYPVLARCDRAASTRSASMSTLTTRPDGPTMCLMRAAL